MIWGLVFGGPLGRLGGPSAKKEPTFISFSFQNILQILHFIDILSLIFLLSIYPCN